MYSPRDYQEEGIRVSSEILNSKKQRREIVISPTAGGKSLYVAFAVKSVDFPVIVLQPNVELLKQNYAKYLEIGGEAKIYSASMKSSEIGKVTFATIGSIKKAAEEVKSLGVRAIIIDEAHLGTQSGSDISDFIKSAGIVNVLGLTATPLYLKGGLGGAELKMMNRVRGAMFKDIAHVTQISELVGKGFWSKILYTVEKIDNSLLQLNSNSSDYTLESQKEYYKGNELENKICDYVRRLKKDNRKSILIFVPTIDDAESLSTFIPGSRVIHSKTKSKERVEIVDGFKDMSIDVVINVNILSVGFDHPRLDAIITARSTASINIYYQQIGRGVRIHKDKKNCRVIDLSGNYETFGKVEDINFEKIPGWGWGMFSGDKLLSNYPIAATKRPTKESLVRGVKSKIKETFSVSRYKEEEPIIIWFGKHKGKSVNKVHEDFPFYLPWVMDNFDFGNTKMIKLKRQIEKILNL